MFMTAKTLRENCEKNKQYRTPYLNDKLYLHYKGFRRIENLDEYTGVKVLFLEGNGFTKIEGLENCKDLRTLYLQENLIEYIENLEHCPLLDTVNLCQNTVYKIENLSHLKNLKTLLLKQNQLRELEDVEQLANLESLTCVDLSNNKIESPEVLEILVKCKNLAVLYLQGNPCVKKMKHYRKMLTARIPTLRYIDDRPIFPEDRLRAEAWYAGYMTQEGGNEEAGRTAEKEEITRQRTEKRAKEEANFKAFEAMMLQGQRIRQQRESQENKEDVASESAAFVNPHSGEEVITLPERPELKVMREHKLATWKDREESPAQDSSVPPTPPGAAAVSGANVPVSQNRNLQSEYSNLEAAKEDENDLKVVKENQTKSEYDVSNSGAKQPVPDSDSTEILANEEPQSTIVNPPMPPIPNLKEVESSAKVEQEQVIVQEEEIVEQGTVQKEVPEQTIVLEEEVVEQGTVQKEVQEQVTVQKEEVQKQVHEEVQEQVTVQEEQEDVTNVDGLD